MKKLTGFGIEKDGFKYELDLGWDDLAFEEGGVSFELNATKSKIENSEEIQSISVTVSVEKNESDVIVLKIVASNEIVFEEPLENLFDEGQVIDQIPGWVFGGGDPIMGCLIRSGLSAVIGQSISCKNLTEGIEGLIRLRNIGKCLLANIPGMCGKMAYKAAWCIARFGF